MANGNDGKFTEQYHGFTVEGRREDPTNGDFQRWNFHVTKNQELAFALSIRISATQAEKVGGEIMAKSTSASMLKVRKKNM